MPEFSRSRGLAAALHPLLAFAVLGLSSYAAAATLTIAVSGVKDTSGQVAIAVFAGPEDFPKDDTKAIRRIVAPIDGATKSAKAVVPDLPAGTYAIAAFHDNDNSGKLETNLFGMPTKGYGFSNNPKPKLRAARYDEARFELPNAGATVEIQLTY
ncbi:MAG: DUF2141 domain-containing protein [Burkholderiaceae bacterium]